MADRRKLQGEVDRCLKKVGEGCEAFEDIWKKVQNATNLNQKEKYEAELKKEIKKLQRHREQIKTWAASSDIKDKKVLLDNRKLIELQMERFRVIEKETKTKAYSKEGLGQANKVDPETKEKGKCRDWLNDSIGSLGIQIDQMESEIESLNAGTKKKKLDKDKVDRMDELNERIEKHRFHITQLEHILRLLDNESIEVDMVNKVHEDIEYYIDNNQEPDFEMDMDGIYDDLDLDVIEGEALKNHDDKDGDDSVHSSPSSSLTTTSSFLAMSSSPSKSISGSPRKNSKSSTSSMTSSLNGVTTATITIATASSTASSPPMSPSATTTSSPLKRSLFTSSSTNNSFSSSISSSSSTESETTTAATTCPTPMVNGIDHTIVADATSSSTSSSSSSSSSSSYSSGLITTSHSELSSTSTTPYSIAASSQSISVASSSTISTVVNSFTSPKSNLLPSEEETAVQAVRNHVESLKHPGYNTNNSIWRTNSSTTQSDTLTLSIATSSNASDNTAVTSLAETSASLETSPTLLSSTARPVSSTLSPLTTSGQSSINFPSISFSKNDSSQTTDFSNLQTSSLFGGVLNHGSLVQKPPTSDTQEVRLQPVHGVAPLGPVHLSQERVKQLKMLDSAFHHLPQRQDSERMRPYISRSAVPIAAYHHHAPPPNIDSLEFFQKLSTETLFFIFYYQEGTRAQYLAAKALKKQSWRFHTKYMMWFQRHEEPKRITDEYEEGTYIFFDYEKWSQRKRDGFTFEYRFLEDKDLP